MEPFSRAHTDAGVWAAEGPSALSLLSDRRSEATSLELGGQRLGSISAVTVVVKGKAHVEVTNATTVQELLSAMRIEPDGDDQVVPPPDTPLSRTHRIRYSKVEFRMRNRVVRITLPPRTVTTGHIPLGYTQELSPGRPEQILRSYRVRYIDGRPVSRRIVGSLVLDPGARGRALRGLANHAMTGDASWYYVASNLTAASPWLPRGTVVTVTNLDTGAQVTVVINDRGPFGGRIIDLSERAFSHIAPLGQGVAHVRITW